MMSLSAVSPHVLLRFHLLTTTYKILCHSSFLSVVSAISLTKDQLLGMEVWASVVRESMILVTRNGLSSETVCNPTLMGHYHAGFCSQFSLCSSLYCFHQF